MRTSGGLARRPSIRWESFDYSSASSYFVTVCVNDRSCLFGKVERSSVILTPLGKLVEEAWAETANIRPGVVLDQHVVMPNHFHSALFNPGGNEGKRSLGMIMNGFKGAVTSQALRQGWISAPFWQPRFYDQVIRSARHLENVRKYIAENPANWPDDEFYVP